MSRYYGNDRFSRHTHTHASCSRSEATLGDGEGVRELMERRDVFPEMVVREASGKSSAIKALRVFNSDALNQRSGDLVNVLEM